MKKLYRQTRKSHAKTKGKGKVSISLLMRIYRNMKEKPNKVWVSKDFSINSASLRLCWNVLLSLDIVEQVPAEYYCGKKRKTRREIKGFRLLQK